MLKVIRKVLDPVLESGTLAWIGTLYGALVVGMAMGFATVIGYVHLAGGVCK